MRGNYEFKDVNLFRENVGLHVVCDTRFTEAFGRSSFDLFHSVLE